MTSLRVERLTFRSMGPSRNAIKISVPVHNIEVIVVPTQIGNRFTYQHG